jgi:L-ascorbate metabolism protein UlaG (beta-lactamase superfamily)
MQIQLISHACVIVTTGDTRILCDPWLFGPCFNDSWSLFPAAAWDLAWLHRIDYLWISHEHPDHFHIPTLRSFPDDFKNRVVVLYQENNSRKMWDELSALGFARQKSLAHREVVSLTHATSVYCYQEGQMNSALAVMSRGLTVLNVNDAEIRASDCRLIRREIGCPDVVLNQFSIAGYGGLEPADVRLAKLASGILTNMVANHRDLGARVTIPFASFMYFSVSDNWHVNRYANRPRAVQERFCCEGLDVAILYPGETYVVGELHDNRASLSQYDEAYKDFDQLPLKVPQQIELAEVEAAFQALCADLHRRYPGPLLRVLRPFSVRIVDLGASRSFSISSRRVEDIGDASVDMDVYSQPLWFAFKYPYGVQTLGVSARATVHSGVGNWRAHRVLFAMNNAEVYLKPRLLFTTANLRHLRRRLRGGAAQLMRRLHVEAI